MNWVKRMKSQKISQQDQRTKCLIQNRKQMEMRILKSKKKINEKRRWNFKIVQLQNIVDWDKLSQKMGYVSKVFVESQIQQLLKEFAQSVQKKAVILLRFNQNVDMYFIKNAFKKGYQKSIVQFAREILDQKDKVQ
ncbi:unnamed protein product [Paramecium sonneborni]|uniref:Uncharacterized protein n=1 Tax=Paramecium sonneborni TaxID=65129 RepID=A0A8S1RR10_9CILI|nr:unnamed protein product [Paramecium sonneborni]